MKIDKITITGLDNIEDLPEILKLQEEFPFCEWGILFSSNKIGTNRYPDFKTINKICDTNLPLSAHFCGSWAKEVLELCNYDLIKNLHPSFKRVQLNYNFSFNNKWILKDLKSNRKIILQYNKSNKDILDKYMPSFSENINILFDASGGRGTEIKEISAPFKNYTGYAGGITPENIDKICKLITNFHNNSTVYIDMESGVRTDNKLDLDKINKILTICKKYI